VDLFLGPYLKVLGGGILRLLALLVFEVLDVPLLKHEPPDTRTNVLGDINPNRP
jgi:hypothetical protein